MEPELYRALRAKDLAHVKECLQHWGKGNRRLWWSDARRAPSPLHVASKNSSQDILMELLRHPEISQGINAFTDKTLVTPLHEAAGSSSPEVVRLLLEAGADLTALSGDRSTALHIACSRGRLDTCAELLRQGSALEGRDGESMTPLLRATVAGRADVTKWLLIEGADPAAVDVTNNTSLALSCYAKNPGIARALLAAGAKVVSKNADGRCCAHLAVLSGESELLRLMLKAMASSGERFNDGGGEMLFDAVDNGLSSIVDLLTSKRGLDLGVDINRPNDAKEGTNALHVACFRGQQHVVDRLLSRGAAPDTADHHGLRPLHIACASPDSQPVVKALLDSNASANVIDSFGCSPVYYAYIRGNDNIVRYMLSQGASLYRMDYDQALRMACFYGMTVEVEYLMWMEADPNGVAYYNHRDRGAPFHRSVTPSVRDGINRLLAENGRFSDGDVTSAPAVAKATGFGGQARCASPGCGTESATSSEWTSDGTGYSRNGEDQSSSCASGLSGCVHDSSEDQDGGEDEDDDIGDDDAFLVPSVWTLDRVLGRPQDGAERQGGAVTEAAAAVKRWGQRVKAIAGKGKDTRNGDEAQASRRGGLGGVKDLAREKIADVIKWASSPRPRKAGSFFED